MIRLENGLERNFSLWKDVRVLQEELKTKGQLMEKSVVTQELLIWCECVNYVSSQNGLCGHARWI